MSRKWQVLMSFGLGLFATACGGGGGGNSGGGGTTPQPTPTITITLSDTTGSAATKDDFTVVRYETKATASGIARNTVYPELTYDRNVIGAVTAEFNATTNVYTVAARTQSDLSVGTYTGTITFRLCKETPCVTVYPGSTVTYTYNLTVGVQDWLTYQRTGGRSGYVPITVDVSKIVKAWEWTAPTQEGRANRLDPVVTENGLVFVTQPTSTELMSPTISAFNETTGDLVWSRTFTSLFFTAPPAVSKGRILLQVSTGEVIIFDSATGDTLQILPHDAGRDYQVAPASLDGNFYAAGAPFGGGITAFAAAPPAKVWRSNASVMVNAWQAPSASDQFVYFNTGQGIDMFDRASGVLQASVRYDPVDDSGISYYRQNFGSPVVGKDGVVFSYWGGGESDFDPYYNERYLVAMDTAAKTLKWKSSKKYITTPAYANGVIYTGRHEVDAIDEKTGAVIWSMPLPTGDTSFVKNVVVTNNVLFVSSDIKIYAIDLASKSIVWSYPVMGVMSLSAGGTLFVTSGLDRWGPGNNTLVAFSVR